MTDGEVLGVEDQIETEDNDAQSQQDQGQEANVSGNEEGQVTEEGAAKDVDGTTEESEVQSGGEGVEQEGDDQEEDGSDKESKDSLGVGEESEGICEQEGEDDVCDDVDVGSSEPVSLEIDNDSQNEEKDAAGNADPFLSLDPFVGDLSGGFFSGLAVDSGGGDGGSTDDIFKSEESQGDEGDEVLDGEEGIELSEEDDSSGGSFVEEFAGVRKVINDMVAHRMKEFR